MKKRYRNPGLFGPKRKTVWKEFAALIQADYLDRGRWKTDQVVAYHKNWEITFDTFTVSTGSSTVSFTRIRAPFLKRDDFTFRIYRKSALSGLGKMLGMQDVLVGHQPFDDDFIIQGNDERKLRMLFEHPQVRQLAGYQRYIELKLQPAKGGIARDTSGQIRELYFHIPKIIRNLEQLQDLYALFCTFLDQLYEIGTAEEDAINFPYK